MDVQCGNFDWHTDPGEVVCPDGTPVMCRICHTRPVVDPVCVGCGAILDGPDCCDQCLQGTSWEGALCDDCSNEPECNLRAEQPQAELSEAWRVTVHVGEGEWTEFCEYWCQGADAPARSAAVLAEWSAAHPAVRIERTRDRAGKITVVDRLGMADHALTEAEKSWFRVWCKKQGLHLPNTPAARAAGMGAWWLGRLLPRRTD